MALGAKRLVCYFLKSSHPKSMARRKAPEDEPVKDRASSDQITLMDQAPKDEVADGRASVPNTAHKEGHVSSADFFSSSSSSDSTKFYDTGAQAGNLQSQGKGCRVRASNLRSQSQGRGAH
mmetsp:Transcript_6727/g.15608  ORF Transcript_6727/g.15608 Transcript_6727/m.15608 type:complete len:121 (+) Transcript_6727:359-721(+)